MIGLYIHVPFCRRKCHYCNFVSTADASEAMRKKYFAGLEEEIKWTKSQGALSGEASKVLFNTLYLGGGSPSILSPEEMKHLVGLIRASFGFAFGYEFTCEVNPGEIDDEKLRAYQQLGINRISLGAQAFQDPLLKEMGRTHQAQDIFEAVRLFRDAAINNISLDLMIRLPNQKVEDVTESVKIAISLGVTQVTVYDLDVHEKTAFGVRQKKGELALPNENEHMEMFRTVETYLTQAGFVHYELMSFAKPGFESQHNLIYWHNQAYLGLGPAAFSYLGGVRYQFATDVDRYFKKIEMNDWTADVRDALSDKEKETETLLTGLRLAEGVGLNRFKIIRPQIDKNMESFVDAGLMEQRGGYLALTQKGRYVAEGVISQFVGQINDDAG